MRKMRPDDNLADELVEKIIQEKNDILIQADEMIKKKDYRKAAKLYRQAASRLRRIDSIIDTEQNFSERNTLNDLSGRRWLKSTKSWIIADGKPSDIPKEIKNHPASYPPSLASHFIEKKKKKGDWVLDHFMGIGSTMQACCDLKRNCWGIELNPVYAQYARDRIRHEDESQIRTEVFVADARNALTLANENNIPQAEFLITSPPYWNILKTSRGGVQSTHKKRIKEGLDEVYSDKVEDLGNISSYQQYLEAIVQIFSDIKKILTSDAYLCVIVQNIRPKNGIMRPLAWDIGRRLGKVYDLRQEFIWCQNQKNLGIWGYPTTYVSNVHHHYCLIFQNNMNAENTN